MMAHNDTAMVGIGSGIWKWEALPKRGRGWVFVAVEREGARGGLLFPISSQR